MILQESEISVLDEAMPKKSLTYLAILESVKAINRGKKVKKINRLKTCAICTRFYSALQALGRRDNDMSACSRVVLTQMLNVFLTMVGAGIVSLPLAMRASSLYLGCVSLFLAGLACCLSMHLCAWLSRRPLCQTPSNKNAPLLNTGIESTYDVDLLQRADAPSKVLQSYDEIITTYLPPWGSTLGNSTIVILLHFVLALFVDVAHDSITATAEITACAHGYPLRAGICFLMCIFSFPAKLESLKYTSAFGFVSLTYLLGVIVYRCSQRVDDPDWRMPIDPAATLTGVVFAATTQLGAFSAVFNTVAAQAELPENHQRKGHGSCIPLTAAGIALFFYAAFGICGYLTLNGNPPRDILTGFSNTDELMSGARVAICLVSIFKAPLIANPLKQVLRHSLSHYLPKSDLMNTMMVTPLLYLTAFGISSLMPDPSIVMGYVSAFGVNMTMFIIPGFCLRSAGIMEKSVWMRAGGWCLSLFGVLVMAGGLFATIEFKDPSLALAPSPS